MSPYRADPDEGPSSEDLDHFADTAGYCPSCGNEVHDDADLCPGCGTWITGEVLAEPPVHRELRSRFTTLVVVAVLFGMAALMLGIRFF
jgi:hypothetical protein